MFLESQNPAMFGWAPWETADIIPYTWNEHNFPQGVARAAKPWMDAVLNEIVPLINGGIHPGPPNIAGTWGAEHRNNTNNPSFKSFHDFGLALDINAPWNPNNTQPGNGLWQIPAKVGPILRSLGGLSGIEFGDPMHVECHLTAAEIATRFGHPPVINPPKPLNDFPLPAGWYFGPLSGPAESISGMSPTEGASLKTHQASIKRIQKVVGVSSDGMYGPKTQAAVKVWQKSHGLTNDGLTGIKTWTRMGL